MSLDRFDLGKRSVVLETLDYAKGGGEFAMPLEADLDCPPITDDPRWKVIAERREWKGEAFFYSVRTTGVYCRPSCAARRPNPENVAFHRTVQDAEAAGWRPCKRCKPDSESPLERDARRVAIACRTIERSARPVPMTTLAQEAGVHPDHFQKLFKATVGVTPRQYFDACRARRTLEGLRANASVSATMFDAGHVSSGRFYESLRSRTRMSPTELRRGGEAFEIQYTTGPCSLGWVLAARTTRGVCAISLGDDRDSLVRELRKRFWRADLREADANDQQLLEHVVQLVDAPNRNFELPLDIRGTAFEERVWRALRDIPAGTQVTYTDLANALGTPSAARAVAKACAANPLAIAIPCHRVVRRDGSLAGYRWGLARKSVLLERERR